MLATLGNNLNIESQITEEWTNSKVLYAALNVAAQ